MSDMHWGSFCGYASIKNIWNKNSEDNEKVENCLNLLTKAAENSENIMPYILDAVRDREAPKKPGIAARKKVLKLIGLVFLHNLL